MSNYDSSEVLVDPSIEYHIDEPPYAAHLQINLFTATSEKDVYTLHCIHLCSEHGLTRWNVQTEAEDSGDRQITMAQQKSKILPELFTQLKKFSFNLGDPTEHLPPTVECPSE